MTRGKLMAVVVASGLATPVLATLTVGVGFDLGCRVRARRRRARQRRRRDDAVLAAHITVEQPWDHVGDAYAPAVAFLQRCAEKERGR